MLRSVWITALKTGGSQL